MLVRRPILRESKLACQIQRCKAPPFAPAISEYISLLQNALRGLMKTYNGKFLTRPELEALGVICDGDDVSVHKSVVIINPEGLHLGNHVRIDPFCVLSATKSIRLHDRVHIAGHCTLRWAAVELSLITD